MRPLDPRLIARIGPARRAVVLNAAFGALSAVLVVAQALILARVLSTILGVYRDDGNGTAPYPGESAFADAVDQADGLGWWGAEGLGVVPHSVRELGWAVLALAAVTGLRAVTSWWHERLAHRAGVAVVAALRQQVVDHATRLGPRWVASGAGVNVSTVVTRGLDSLMPYFVRYLPQLFLATTVTPALVLVVLGLDWLSALIALATLPLVPLFMWLVGMLTQERSAKHLATMTTLTERTMDLIAGLPTLRGLGRQVGPATRVRELGEAHQRATMGSLRIAFLSGMVLELLTTLSVAIVAVTMGFRLIQGDIGIETALAVLILAPEVYQPLRHVGTHFHASADGLAAADAAFAILDTPVAVRSSYPQVTPVRGRALSVKEVSIATPDGVRDAPHRISVTCQPGAITALIGPNGEGKSTLLMAMAGLLPVDAGTITLDAQVVSDAQGTAANWSRQCAWVPQRPDVGPEGRTLSLGQRQRRALDHARASGRPVVLWDEPTAHLDRAARADVIATLRHLADEGHTVVVATHDQDLIASADAVVEVRDALRDVS